MKKLFLILPIIALSGCSHFEHTEVSAPCDGKTAYIGQNPCNPLPINVG